MSFVLRFFRRILIWTGPLLILLVMVLCGFAYWVLDTAPGTRWALLTAAEQVDGQASGISGTIWDGVRVENFELSLPDVDVKLSSFYLRATWRNLFDRHLHINELSAETVAIDLHPGPAKSEPEAPFKMPVLPLGINIDRLAMGRLLVSQAGQPLPVDISRVSTALAVDESGGQLVVQSLDLQHEGVKLESEGELKLLALQDPWPMRVHLASRAMGMSTDSPLCIRRYLPNLPADDASAACVLDVETSVEGNLEALQLVLKGAGQGMDVSVDAHLTPRAAFPLKDAVADLQMADGSSLRSKLDWTSTTADGRVEDRIVGTLHTDKLNVGRLVGPSIPEALLTMAADFDISLRERGSIQQAQLALAFAEGSRWNKQPLAGHLKSQIVGAKTEASAPASLPPAASPDVGVNAAPAPWWEGLRLAAVDMDLKLGKNSLKAQGSLGANDSRIKLDLMAPELASFWPELPGGAQLKGELAGTLARHQGDLAAEYMPPGKRVDEVGKAPVKGHVVFTGGWGKGAPGQLGAGAEGWRGTVRLLDLEHAGLGVKSRGETAIGFVPGAVAPAWQWQVDKTQLDMLLATRTLFTVEHVQSRGVAGQWQTQGAIARLPVSPKLVSELRQKFDPKFKEDKDSGGVKLKADKGKDLSQIILALDWNLNFAGALEGQAQLRHVSGDVMVPAEPAFPLGLETLTLNLKASRTGGSVSRLTADLDARTAKMGRVSATATTLLHATAGGGLFLDPKDAKTVKIDADIDDLGWTSLFLGDAMELGGAVQADISMESRPDGSWGTEGSISGQKIRVIRIDDGIRLLDGTLAAHIQGNRLILDKLSFPALVRVKPKEWRTAEWVSTNPDAKNGSLTLTGDWNLSESQGVVDVVLYRYPLVQRSDRYAMVSGKLRLTATLPKIAINGAITADAGWFDLDMLGGVPTVDSDVVVLRPGQERKKASAPIDVSMELDVDLGPRFYLTGYGVNSGLVGTMHITMQSGKLTALGSLRTRGGAIEAYGQRLQLRRGTITFQGDITSPVLSIEALRTGLAVEAGVRVAGTAKRPRIDLVSYPAVSEIEKLSWLLLGHGPNDSGGDVALLFSVGSSFLTSGEPFYRKFGIDEVSMRSGDLGSAGSILPAESVVGGLDRGTSDIERRFITVSKKLSTDITLSLQQALADTGTVGKISYRLARGLTAELSAGTTNGLALIYRWFSRD